MKCEHCGKNEATFYYKSNINGTVTEQHLCADCARELGYADSIEKSFADFGRMSEQMFGGLERMFSPIPALAGGFFEPFEEMERRMGSFFPALGAGSAAGAPAEAAAAEKSAPAAPGNDLVSESEHQALNRERRINALRREMQSAIAQEKFEHAAELRDELHKLEQAQ